MLRVLNAHNRHAGAGGMEVLFASITRLLRGRGHAVVELSRDNAQLRGLAGKLAAFGSAIYSPGTYRQVRRLLIDERIGVAHVHNIYPQFSVSLFDACAEAGVPVVLHVQDYKLTCPTAQHLRHGRICDLCMTHGEHHCAIHNCRGSRAMSVAYALRNAAARIGGKIHAGVAYYACCSRFARDLIVRGGFPAERAGVLPNFFDLPTFSGRVHGDGEYVAYVGRISPEKGLDVLTAAAALVPDYPVRVVGDASAMPNLVYAAPPNVEFVGPLPRDQMHAFLDRARMLVVPSVWWEAFGIVAAEAMSRELPVIASDAGGLAEVVDHGVTGLKVPMRDPAALAQAIRQIWQNPAAARAMGQAGRAKAERLYSPDAYYGGLVDIWRRLGLLGPAQATSSPETEETRDAGHTHGQPAPARRAG